MGGHGGLNILPQKRWNVYNYENREKVRKDEEAAAKEEQIKREQSRKRDAEFRLEKLRQVKGLAPLTAATTHSSQSISKSDHINLFEGLKKDFPSLGRTRDDVEEVDVEKESSKNKKKKMMKKEETPRVVLPEDEKYRLGYGVAGKGVKAPWYLSKSSFGESKSESGGDFNDSDSGRKEEGSKKSGKKSLEELREERLKREKKEKEREKALLLGKNKNNQRDGGSISRFNSGFSR